jgi:hypothetical protein
VKRNMVHLYQFFYDDLFEGNSGIDQRYSTFYVRVPPDTISLQLCTPNVVGV